MNLGRHATWMFTALCCAAFAVAPMASSRSAQTPAPLLVSPTGSDARRCTQAAPCATFNRAYHVAQPGQVVQIAAGTYPEQMLVQDPSKGSSKDVVFRPAPRANVVVNGPVNFGDFNTPGPSQITLTGINALQIRAINSTDLTWVNIDARNFYLNGAQRIVIKGGDWGPCKSSVEPCGNSKIDLADPALPENRNITIDGATFHDYRIGKPDDHFECLIIFSGVGITIRNSKFSDCEFYDIFLPFVEEGRPIAGLTIENNWFDTPWNGQNVKNRGGAIAFAPRDHSFRDILIRRNSFAEPAGVFANEEASQPVYANFRIEGNILPRSGRDCYPSVTQGNNLVQSGPLCTETDRQPPFGYVVEKGRLKLVKGQAAAIQLAFVEAAKGTRLSRIVAQLRRTRALGPVRGRWTVAALRAVLADRVYLGGLYGATGAHPRMVKRGTWAAAQKLVGS